MASYHVTTSCNFKEALIFLPGKGSCTTSPWLIKPVERIAPYNTLTFLGQICNIFKFFDCPDWRKWWATMYRNKILRNCKQGKTFIPVKNQGYHISITLPGDLIGKTVTKIHIPVFMITTKEHYPV